jgi:LDH2 family malate/lactate/ureidoglycolate dehydrogenase
MNYYVKMAASEGMIGMAATNALPTMAPIGGAERIVGMNPVGFGIPGGDEGPIIYDAAFGATAHGKLRVMAQKGLPIPEGWATDSAGNPTTDAAEAVEGMILPSGGHKGIGMAMVMGVLSSLLSGAAYGTELGNMEAGPRAGQDGHFVAAINVSFFDDLDTFRGRVDAVSAEVHGVKRAVGVDRTHMPGEIEREKRQRYERIGIPLNLITLSDIRRTAQSLGVNVDSYRWLPA